MTSRPSVVVVDVMIMFDVEADVLVNLIGDEAPTLDRASRVSAEFCKVVGPQLQTVRFAVYHRCYFRP